MARLKNAARRAATRLEPAGAALGRALERDEVRYTFLAIALVGVSLGVAFLAGQLTYHVLDLRYASTAGHLYSIVSATLVFFFFARHLRRTKDLLFVRRFLGVYFATYGLGAFVLLLGLQVNLVYFYSTLGNALILFSAFTLVIFILSPEILGIVGHNVRGLFLSGQHVRVIVVYLTIALLQVTGFALLNYSIHLQALEAIAAGGGGPGGVGPADQPAQTAFNAGATASILDFFYFSTITFTTIGFGDFAGVTAGARLSSILQAFLSHVISLLFLAILLLYLGSSSSADYFELGGETCDDGERQAGSDGESGGVR